MDTDKERVQDRCTDVARPRAGYRTLQLFVLKPSAGIKTSSEVSVQGWRLARPLTRGKFQDLKPFNQAPLHVRSRMESTAVVRAA